MLYLEFTCLFIIALSYFFSGRKWVNVLIGLLGHICLIVLWFMGLNHFGVDSQNRPYTNSELLNYNIVLSIACILSLINIFFLLRRDPKYLISNYDYWMVGIFGLLIILLIFASGTLFLTGLVFFPFTISIGLILFIISLVRNRKYLKSNNTKK